MEMVNSDHQVSLDINKLAESVEEELKILRPFSDKCSIYRVPKQLRKLNESAYTPQVVSIGPLHHGREELKEMEEHKKMSLNHFLIRSKVSIQEFMAAIAERENRLRNCYRETFENLSSVDFVRMMLIDCSFVITVVLGICFKKLFGRINDHIFNKPWMKVAICYDMCLLENQLPFFILEYLLKLSKICNHSMVELTDVFISNIWDYLVPDDVLERIKSFEVEHFVDFLRICQQPMKQEQPKRLRTLTTPSIVELHEAGVKFKFGSTRKLLPITFDENKGILEIPQLRIDDSTEQVIRNLYAFEQCHSSISDKFVSLYIAFC